MSRNLNRVIDGLLSGSPTEWIVFLAAASGIAFAAWAVSRFRASLRGDADPAAADAQLARLARDLRDRGAVSEDEYRSLKGRLGRAGEGDTRPPAAPTRLAADLPAEGGLPRHGRHDHEGRTRPGSGAETPGGTGGVHHDAAGGQGRPAGNPEGRSKPPRHAC